ncbi:MAG: DUF4445 domain-containing protein [Deltaproteobacteria bacterium]|nr:DUF4445 domain-containing protein [Deltaproteobacteria bacterium]
MARLTVRSGRGEEALTFQPGATLRQILAAGTAPVRAGCRGFGACGLCRVRVLDGPAGEPSPAERLHLGQEGLAGGLRLACQVTPQDDLTILLLAPASRPAWRALAGPELPQPPTAVPVPGLPAGRALGAVVDLGTTHLSLAVYDLAQGRGLAGRRGPNPQAGAGADVVTRLVAAAASEQAARDLGGQVVAAVGEALEDLAAREGLDLGRLGRLLLVGNTPMLALLTGQEPARLLCPDAWEGAADAAPGDPAAWATAWGLAPGAQVEVVPPLAGFAGSDILAGCLAARLETRDGPALLVDFGTNTEIALWDGATLWVTSAAGGPAFEGSGLGCGLPAGEGAIHRVEAGEQGLTWQVLGGGPPQGFCGSGLVDLVAVLLDTGRLTPRGKFTAPGPADRVALVPARPELALTKRDVDLFQQAKAAVGAGVALVCSLAGLAPGELRRVVVAGSFGCHLNPASAQRIGLLPPMPVEAVELAGNTALAGAAQLLLTAEAPARAARLRAATRQVNLARAECFEDLYLDNLFLQPMKGR